MSSVLPNLKKIYRTPLSDLIRLRLTNRLDWRAAISQSELPVDVQHTITNVVAQTGLWRSEKASVADELISHFKDGNDSGLTYENLLNTFGDASVASRLIRRAKQRNRSMASKIAKAFGWTTLAALISIVLFWFYFRSLKANPTVNYLATITESVRTADDDDKAWPLYRDAWIKHRFCSAKEQGAYYQVLNNDLGRTCSPTDDKWDEAVTWVESRKDLLDAFRSGADRPLLGIELQSKIEDYSDIDQQALHPDWHDRKPATKEAPTTAETVVGDSTESEEFVGGTVIGTLMQHIQMIRVAAQMFQIDTQIAIEQKDSQRALINIQTTAALANQITDTNFIVTHLVSENVAQQAFEQIELVLTQSPELLTDDQLNTLQATATKYQLDLASGFETYKVSIRDIVQQIYTDNGDGDGQITQYGLAVMSGLTSGDDKKNTTAFLYNLMRSSRKSTIDAIDELVEIAKKEYAKPKYEKLLSEEEMLQTVINKSGVNQALIRQFAPQVLSFQSAKWQSEARRNSVLIAIAAEQYRRNNGKFPSAAEQLKNGFIRSFPTDPMNGKELKYDLHEGKPRIYSVGWNGDDDGGKLIFDNHGRPLAFGYGSVPVFAEGDWILWPTPAWTE
ncbi:MAG: hypothetical protein AB8B55_16460 [Mariniblastus sp.]